MNVTRHQHDEIEAAFIAALECPPDTRDDFVRDACGSDQGLEARVWELLRDHDLAEQAIRAPLETDMSLPGLRPGQAVEGQRIGRYTVRRVIASGGMGVVYEAVQEQPRRTVALKVMRPGLLSRTAAKRFEYESQILARLRHPNIAQVYEAGTHEDATGRMPFFAMEYVPDALPLTEYARVKKLGTRERLELFETVCDAVQHGHRKGVIHRDLKPGNILVDSAREPKVIDFGVARATDSDMAVTTLHTDVGQLIGTLQYMSPEQCEADPHDLDSRSDVYALGVVLYELLCGRPPYDVADVAVHEAVRVIRDETPTRPSTIDRALRGDLETIALKALEKDRARRYQGAAELAADVRRYLSDEPIVARPPSAWYQLRKFSKRNRALVAGAAFAIAALAVGTSVATWQAVRAGHEAATAMAVKEFLSETFAAADFRQQGHRVTVEEVLDGAVDAIAENFADDPVTEGEVRQLFGRAYQSMSRLDKAETQFRLARERRRVGLGEEHPDTITSAAYVAAVLKGKSLLKESAELRRWVIDARGRVLGPDHPSTLGTMSRLAVTLAGLAEYDEAVEMARSAADRLAETVGPEDDRTFRALLNLSSVLRSASRFREAKVVGGAALDSLRHARSDDDPLTVDMQMEQSRNLYMLGDVESAEPLATAALQSMRSRFGDDDLRTVTWMEQTGSIVHKLGQRERGEQLLREGVAGLRRLAGDQLRTAYAMHRLAFIVMNHGDFDEAVELSLESIQIKIESLGEDHWHIPNARLDLGNVYRNAGRFDEAEPVLREAVDRLTETVGREHHRTMTGVYRLGYLLAQRGDLASAEPLLREFLDYCRREWPDHAGTLDALNAIAWLMKDGTPDQLAYAEELARECADRCLHKFPQGHAMTANALNTIGVILHMQERCDDAVASFDEALTATGSEDWAPLSVQQYADCLDAVGRTADADAVWARIVE